MDIALISVLITGGVAISSVLLAPLMNLWVESVKARRDSKSASIKKVEETAKELLAALAQYQTDIHMTGKRPLEEIYADILSRGYWWELAVTPYCNKDEASRIVAIRDIYTDRTKTRGQMSMDAIKEILKVTQLVIARIK